MSEDDSPSRSKQAGSLDAASKGHSRWKLPGWLDHFNSHDLKTFARCWVATWVATLLIFIHPALENIGQATFFGALLLIVAPPASILLVYIFAAFSLLLGMCLAWAWGLLTMKAALAARPDSQTQAKVMELQQAAVAAAKQTGQSPEAEAQILVHDGFMLDARVTAVFFSLGLLFMYVVSRMRSKNPKLLLLQLFGSIVTNLFMLFGSGLPAYKADLAVILVKPGAIGIALGTICCLFFFPQSASFDAMDKMEKLIRLFNVSVTTTLTRLRHDDVSMAELKTQRAKMLMLYKSIEPIVAFLPLDVSRGRWSGPDVKILLQKARDPMVAALSLLDFHIDYLTLKQKEAKLEKVAAEDENSEGHDAAGQRQLHQSADLMYALRNPEWGAMDARALDAVKDPGQRTLKQCTKSFELAARSIGMANRCRWIRKPSQQSFDALAREVEDCKARLQAVTDECVVNATEGIVENYSDVFNENGELKDPGSLGPPSLKGLVLAMIIEERILSLARTTQGLLEYLLKLHHERQSHRLWIPSRLKYAFAWLSRGNLPGAAYSPSANGNGDNSNDADTDPDLDDDQASQSKEAYRRLRFSRGYPGRANRRNILSKSVAATWWWLFNPAGMFALRFVIVTFATSIPAVIPHSAGFFYREKGIWAVITAQTSCSLLMADFTFSLYCRVLGTIFGGVAGMIAWYIGSGDGTGNPYGMAVTTAFMLLLIVWLRIFLAPEYTKATLLAGVTFLLVIGFSYDQNHIVQYGLPGVGYEAFWKRLVCVLIGVFAAAVVHVLPRPPSATDHVCKTLANTVSTLSDHYALLLSHWSGKSNSSPVGAVAEEISLRVADNLLALNPMIAQLPLEFSLTPFDRQLLKDSQSQIQFMNQALRRLLNLSTTLPKELQDRLARTVGFLDDRVIGQTMAVLDIVEQTLRTGSPLPERLPTPLVRRFYESWDARDRHAMLSVALVRDENYRRYCVALSSYLKFLASIDDLVLVLKETLGECHVIHQWEEV